MYSTVLMFFILLYFVGVCLLLWIWLHPKLQPCVSLSLCVWVWTDVPLTKVTTDTVNHRQCTNTHWHYVCVCALSDLLYLLSEWDDSHFCQGKQRRLWICWPLHGRIEHQWHKSTLSSWLQPHAYNFTLYYFTIGGWSSTFLTLPTVPYLLFVEVNLIHDAWNCTFHLPSLHILV